MIDPVEKALHAVYSRSPECIKRLFREIAYWLCEWLGGYVARRTSCETNNTGAAIAAVRMLDMKNLVAVPDEDLPELLRGALPPFTPAEWKSVLASAHMDQGSMEQALACYPEWSHLRKMTATSARGITDSTRSIWAYNWSNGNGPLLFVAREWVTGSMSGITLERIWLHEYDAGQHGDERELSHIRGWLQDDGHLARLVADGTVKRVGELPDLTEDTYTPKPPTEA